MALTEGDRRGVSEAQRVVGVSFEGVDGVGEGGTRNPKELVGLGVRIDASESLPTAVDLVDVHSMAPRFASVTLEEGTVILGTETRRAALRERYGGESVSLAEARERVAAAAQGLREGTSG